MEGMKTIQSFSLFFVWFRKIINQGGDRRERKTHRNQTFRRELHFQQNMFIHDLPCHNGKGEGTWRREGGMTSGVRHDKGDEGPRQAGKLEWAMATGSTRERREGERGPNGVVGCWFYVKQHIIMFILSNFQLWQHANLGSTNCWMRWHHGRHLVHVA